MIVIISRIHCIRPKIGEGNHNLIIVHYMTLFCALYAIFRGVISIITSTKKKDGSFILAKSFKKKLYYKMQLSENALLSIIKYIELN